MLYFWYNYLALRIADCVSQAQRSHKVDPISIWYIKETLRTKSTLVMTPSAGLGNNVLENADYIVKQDLIK